MRVIELGDGTPEVAVVGGIHGDEPCGPTAIDRFLTEAHDVERSVKFIVANQEALAANTRYIDEDLNRAFPGAPDAETHEGWLAHRLAIELRGCTILSLHSTQSYAEPFALCDTVDEVVADVVPSLPVEVLIETGRFTNGRLIEHAQTIEVECGLQGTQSAAENGYWLIRAFLDAMGVLEASEEEKKKEKEEKEEEEKEEEKEEDTPGHMNASKRDPIPVFRLEEKLPKPPANRYEVFASNFLPVETGDRFAEADGAAAIAERDFYPVLLSADGYEDVFGYAARKVGTLG